jgi:GNAT superfamily N-acetyltransferase
MGDVTPHPRTRGPKVTPPARLDTSHDFSKFDCGKQVLNDWLRNTASGSEGTTARTYVVCIENRVVVGYYCISTGSIERKALPAKFKRQQGIPNQIPVAIIGRLAVDFSYKRIGLGHDLLSDALKRVASAAEIIGIRAVLVHALDEESVPFYTEHKFQHCPTGDRTFFLPIETIVGSL